MSDQENDVNMETIPGVEMSPGEIHRKLHRGNVAAHKSIEKIFSKLSTLEFMTLLVIAKKIDQVGEDGRVYLQDLAKQLKIPVSEASKMAQRLSDKGLILWTHDAGSERGTYIQITSAGNTAAGEQQEILRKFYASVIDRFGRERFLELLKQMDELEMIMEEEVGKEDTSDT